MILVEEIVVTTQPEEIERLRADNAELVEVLKNMGITDLLDIIKRLRVSNAELVAALRGMLEIAGQAMPESFFASDSRVTAARAAIEKANA